MSSILKAKLTCTRFSIKSSPGFRIREESVPQKWDSKDGSTITWWRHQMETFFALLAICAGNSPVSGEFPAQRPVTRSFDVFFDLCLNERLRKQSWGWWFETLSRPLWRHCNDTSIRREGVGSMSNRGRSQCLRSLTWIPFDPLRPEWIHYAIICSDNGL